jgi:hypothetical protein
MHRDVKPKQELSARVLFNGAFSACFEYVFDYTFAVAFYTRSLDGTVGNNACCCVFAAFTRWALQSRLVDLCFLRRLRTSQYLSAINQPTNFLWLWEF